MSGFLRRLSAQALGSAAPVRSATRLPYAAGPMQLNHPMSEEVAHEVAPAPMPHPFSTERQTIAAGPLQADGPFFTSAPHVARARAHLDSFDKDPPIELPPPLIDRPRSPELRREAEASPQRHASFVDTADAASAVVSERRPPPPPLLPPQTRFTPSAAVAFASRPPADSEAHEVHVTIGRIEITAVHEAPPPRRAPAAKPAKKLMSLDDYLAKRQPGRG
ncbi:hypothetical protein [Hydrocarboniphaga sp.]|uniref:hypothetical protein n=1 Tax=Hydrocarboniphaga sp. TaxID=2033016 RepID=UPI00262F50C6|nr:hypothetical protein [Hydrocarboniphaga sp.]